MQNAIKLALAVFAAACPIAAAAQAPAEFYKGRTVNLQIGSGVGGGYDAVGRLFARHIGKYIPGQPSVVPQNVPGGGSLQLSNQFAAIAPRDGSTFGIVNNGVPSTPLLTPSVAKFDPRKFNYLGSPSREGHVMMVWETSKIRTIEDLFTKEAIIGATAPGGAVYDFPFLANAVLGTKFKIITGYQSSNTAKLAMERGEIDGQAGMGWVSVKTDYGTDLGAGRIRIVSVFGFEPLKEIPNVPLMPTGKTQDERQLFELMYSRQRFGRPFITPPDVPADRLAALRQAFEDTMKDKDFLAEAVKQNIEVEPVKWQELQELVEKLYKTPDHVVKRMQETLASVQKK